MIDLHNLSSMDALDPRLVYGVREARTAGEPTYAVDSMVRFAIYRQAVEQLSVLADDFREALNSDRFVIARRRP